MESEILAKIHACKTLQAYFDKLEHECGYLAEYEFRPYFNRVRAMIKQDLDAYRVQLAEVRGE